MAYPVLAQPPRLGMVPPTAPGPGGPTAALVLGLSIPHALVPKDRAVVLTEDSLPARQGEEMAPRCHQSWRLCQETGRNSAPTQCLKMRPGGIKEGQPGQFQWAQWQLPGAMLTLGTEDLGSTRPMQQMPPSFHLQPSRLPPATGVQVGTPTPGHKFKTKKILLT